MKIYIRSSKEAKQVADKTNLNKIMWEWRKKKEAKLRNSASASQSDVFDRMKAIDCSVDSIICLSSVLNHVTRSRPTNHSSIHWSVITFPCGDNIYLPGSFHGAIAMPRRDGANAPAISSSVKLNCISVSPLSCRRWHTPLDQGTVDLESFGDNYRSLIHPRSIWSRAVSQDEIFQSNCMPLKGSDRVRSSRFRGILWISGTVPRP